MLIPEIKTLKDVFSRQLADLNFNAEENENKPDVIGYVDMAQNPFLAEATLMLSRNHAAVEVVPSFIIYNDGELDNDEFTTCLKVLTEGYDELSIVSSPDDDSEFFMIAEIPLESLTPENVKEKISDVLTSFSRLDKDISVEIDNRIFESCPFNPITHSEFDCPECGTHISLRPNLCPNCGAEVQDEDRRCDRCGERLDVCFCPTCHYEITQDVLAPLDYLSEEERRRKTHLATITHRIRQFEQNISGEGEKNFYLGKEIKEMLPEVCKGMHLRVDCQFADLMKVHFRLKPQCDLYVIIESENWIEGIAPLIELLPSLQKEAESIKSSKEYKQLKTLYPGIGINQIEE